MSFSAAYGAKKHNRKMAKGGDVKSDDEKVAERKDRGLRHYGGPKPYYEKGVHEPSVSGPAAHLGKGNSKEAHAKVIAEARSMPGPTSGMSGFAKGGEVSDHEKDADMIARIMHKRKEYSEGGMVANDVGVAEADKLPAEYDDLVLRDELDGSQPEDSNEHGDELPEDMVSRVMLKKKKDRMPRPA